MRGVRLGSLLSSSAPEARAWVQPVPPPLLFPGLAERPRPTAGAAEGLGRRGRDSPPRVRVSPPDAASGLRAPSAVRRPPPAALLGEPLQGSAASPTGSGWRRRRQRGSHGDWKGGDLQTLRSGDREGGWGDRGSGVCTQTASKSACRRAGENREEIFQQKYRLENKQRRAGESARKYVHVCVCVCVCV